MSESVFIIAEAGVNHNGSIDQALALVEVAANAGANAVKFQTFKAEELVTPDLEQCDYQLQNAKADSQYAMLKDLELGEEDYRQILKACQKANIEFMSTAFDPKSLEYLVHDLDMTRIKIPSGELINPLLLLSAGRSGRPVIVSTGMADLSEIEHALKILAFAGTTTKGVPDQAALDAAYASQNGKDYLAKTITLLHCTSSYPAKPESVNLRAMQTMATTFGLPTGLSDHTKGIDIAIASIAMGARTIEKHFTLDRTLPGPDHKASLEGADLKRMIEGIRTVELALGSDKKEAQDTELMNKTLVRRVLVAAKDIEAGDIFDEQSVTLMRAGEGVSATQYWSWLGRKATRSFQKYQCLSE